jgi:hypothetical protein
VISIDDWLKVSTVFFLFSYIDAGTGSLIIQMVIGFLAGGLLALKIFWSRITRFFKKNRSKDQTKERETQNDLPHK